MKVKILIMFMIASFSCVNHSKESTTISKSKSEVAISDKLEVEYDVESSEVKEEGDNPLKRLKENIEGAVRSLGYSKRKGINTKRLLNNPKFGENLKVESANSFSKAKQDNTYIDMIIYEYHSTDESKAIYEKLYNRKGDEVFKDYNIVVLEKEFLIWVKSGCNSQKQKWNNLVQKIKEISSSDNSLYCYCGGYCD